MKRFNFKHLFEGLYSLSKREGLRVPLLYSVSKNMFLMEDEYKSIIAGLKPWFEYEEILSKLSGDEYTEYKSNNTDLIDQIEIFMNGDIEFKPIKISYDLFPEDVLDTFDKMSFWMPILE